MEKVYERCCGLEVHKKTVVAWPPHTRPPPARAADLVADLPA